MVSDFTANAQAGKGRRSSIECSLYSGLTEGNS